MIEIKPENKKYLCDISVGLRSGLLTKDDANRACAGNAGMAGDAIRDMLPFEVHTEPGVAIMSSHEISVQGVRVSEKLAMLALKQKPVIATTLGIYKLSEQDIFNKSINYGDWFNNTVTKIFQAKKSALTASKDLFSCIDIAGIKEITRAYVKQIDETKSMREFYKSLDYRPINWHEDGTFDTTFFSFNPYQKIDPKCKITMEDIKVASANSGADIMQENGFGLDK